MAKDNEYEKPILSESKEVIPGECIQTVSELDPIFKSYDNQLKYYKSKRKTINSYIKKNLKEGVDFGYTTDDKKNRKKTLMKAGAEKIAAYMNCRVKFYVDHAAMQIIGNNPCVCFVAYLIDEKILQLIIMTVLKLGIEYAEQIVKLFAWGEGRGAYEVNELVYSSRYGKGLAGKPLRGCYNRALKMAEKRAETDLIIRTFGLEFMQDPELKVADIKQIYAIAMQALRDANIPDKEKAEYKYKIDNLGSIKDIEAVIDEIKSKTPNTTTMTVKNTSETNSLKRLIAIANAENDLTKKLEIMKQVQENKDNEEALGALLLKYNDIRE